MIRVPGVSRAGVGGKLTAFSKMSAEELKALPNTSLLRSKYIDVRYDHYTPTVPRTAVSLPIGRKVDLECGLKYNA